MTVPSELVSVTEEPDELRVDARGPAPRLAWVSRVSPDASKMLAKPARLVPPLVVTTA